MSKIIKVFWLKANFGSKFNKITEYITEKEYQKGYSYGFLLSKVREDLLEAVYIEEKNIAFEDKDPFGKTEIYNQTRYIYTKFKLNKKKSIIELINPPRTIKPFINDISAAANFEFSVESFNVNINEWILSIKSKFSKIELSKVSIDKIEFPPSNVGKLSIKGKIDLNTIIEKYPKSEIKEIEIIFLHKTFGNGLLILSNNGSCKIKNTPYLEEIKDIIYEGITKLN